MLTSVDAAGFEWRIHEVHVAATYEDLLEGYVSPERELDRLFRKFQMDGDFGVTIVPSALVADTVDSERRWLPPVYVAAKIERFDPSQPTSQLGYLIWFENAFPKDVVEPLRGYLSSSEREMWE